MSLFASLATVAQEGGGSPPALPGLLFAGLAAAMAVAALVPRWRRKVRWGRFGSGPHLSALGWGAWILALAAVSFSLLCQSGTFSAPPEVWAGAVVAAFILVVAAGIHDSARGPDGG